jgi:hypothetical protein
MKPKPKSNSQIIEIVLIATGIIIVAVIMICLSYYYHKSIDKQMHQECLMCSFSQVYQKTCPYTDEEFKAEKYGNSPCSDGSYELSWKLSLGLMFLGIGFIGIAIAVIYSHIQILNHHKP